MENTQTVGFTRSTYHQLLTSEPIVGLSEKVYTDLLKINVSIEKMNGILTSGIRLLHSVGFVLLFYWLRS